MHIKHTVHIRGPQPRVFFSRQKLKYPSFSTATFFPFQEHFYVFFHGRKKITGKKKTVTVHTLNRHCSTCRYCMFTKSPRVSHNYYFHTYDCFLLNGMGLYKKCFERERERDLLCTETRGKKERGNVCSGWVCQKMYGERDKGFSCREARGERGNVSFLNFCSRERRGGF